MKVFGSTNMYLLLPTHYIPLTCPLALMLVGEILFEDFSFKLNIDYRISDSSNSDLSIFITNTPNVAQTHTSERTCTTDIFILPYKET